MCARWDLWLQRITRQDSLRGVAKRAGVAHTTVQRWAAKGVPPARAWELTLKFRGDPIETLVLLGRLEPNQVGDLNYAALLRYAPTVALTAELHSRATTTAHEYPHIKLQKQVAELEAYQGSTHG